MAIGCGTFLAKYCLCAFNFVFFFAGAGVLGVGIWIAADKHSFIAATKIIDNEQLQAQFQQFTQPTVIEQASYILIAAGAFVFVVSFLGYCGALRESRCLLTCYGIFLIVILLMEITAGGLAAGFKDKAEKESRTFLKSSIHKYYEKKNETNAVTLMWNYLMAQMKCCGVDSYKDFSESPKWISGDHIVPEACCVLVGDISNFKLKDPSCPKQPSDSNSYWNKGCFQTVYDWLMDHANVAIGVGIGLGLLQLFGIFFAFCLCQSIDNYLK